MFLQTMIRSSASIAVSWLLMISTGCTTTFKLPEQDIEMERIYLLSYNTWGHHSVAFYRNSTLIEFTYGDWDLFALNRRDAWTAWKNMTFFTQGALGRKVVAWEQGSPLCQSFNGCKEAKAFLAPASKSRELYQWLQAAYQEQIETEVYNQVAQVHFVKYDVSYWGFHNCNHELADWLETLGGEITGRVFLNPDFIGGMEKR